jgi:hypothetical protein
MPDVITRAIARNPELTFPASVTVADVASGASGAVGGAPPVDAPSIGGEPDGRTRFAERAIEDRLRRSIAARSASAPAAAPHAEAAAARAQEDAREWREIDSALREWVDLAKAKPYSESPSRLLRAVMSREQVYLHEMIHALTGALDPVRTVDMLNRGPVVYLTDKILNEGGYAFAEQVMYRRENSLPDMPRYETIEYHRDAAMQAAHAENRYLDPIVDGKRSRVPGATLIEGMPVELRVTARDVREIVREVAMGEVDVFLSMDAFDTKISENFRFSVSENTPTEVMASDARNLANFYRRLYRKSETFRYLFDTMPTVDASVDPAATWRFMLDESAPVGSLAQGASLQPAMRGSKEIYLLEDGLQYLSANGLRDVETERKLTYDMVRAIGGFDRLAPGEAYRNRGPAVYLTDSILKEAGFHYPKQLVAALASDADAVAQNRLLAYQTSAQRAAATEDRYLNRVLTSQRRVRSGVPAHG